MRADDARKYQITWTDAEALIEGCNVSYIRTLGGGIGDPSMGVQSGYGIVLKNESADDMKIIVDLPASADLQRTIQSVSSTCGSISIYPPSP